LFRANTLPNVQPVRSGSGQGSRISAAQTLIMREERAAICAIQDLPTPEEGLN
jgi:hypothetical protein